jgi:hypothetical protein
MSPEDRIDVLERKMRAFERTLKPSSTRLDILVPVTMRRQLTVNGMTIHTGDGSPESVVVAPIGSIYLRLDGGAGSTLYVKEAADIAGDKSQGWSTTA